VADLAASLEKLAGDPVLCRKMGEAGRNRVREQFDWDKRGEQMMEIYREVAGKSGNHRG
jgi:starch synthase